MHHPADPGRLGGVEQPFRVGNGLVEREEPVIKANPVGVEQRIDAGERSGQLARIVKRKRHNLELVAERIRAMRRIGQRPNSLAPREEQPRERFARVAKSPGDDI